VCVCVWERDRNGQKKQTDTHIHRQKETKRLTDKQKKIAREQKEER